MENRAGVNQENVSRQVVPCTTSGRATFFHTLWRFIAISSLCITRANLAVINRIARRSGRATATLHGYIDVFRGASASPTTNPVTNPQR